MLLASFSFLPSSISFSLCLSSLFPSSYPLPIFIIFVPRSHTPSPSHRTLTSNPIQTKPHPLHSFIPFPFFRTTRIGLNPILSLYSSSSERARVQAYIKQEQIFVCLCVIRLCVSSVLIVSSEIESGTLVCLLLVDLASVSGSVIHRCHCRLPSLERLPSGCLISASWEV